mgnify:FL=1
MVNAKEMALAAAKALDSKKGRDIKVLEIDKITTLADYFVICSGGSNTQINALCDEVEKELDQLGEQPIHREGYRGGTWVLLDYGCVAVHVFNEEARAFYGLERLWSDGHALDLTGVLTPDGGEVDMKGSKVAQFTPNGFILENVSHIPEDRNKMGLIGNMSVKDNIVLKATDSPEFSSAKGYFLKKKAIRDYALKMQEKYDIRCTSVEQETRNLSGGNQQKVILARELEGSPDLLVAVHPTRGLDIGATRFVHDTMIEARDKGCGVLLISADFDEILEVSDRIVVMFEGQIMGVFSGKNPPIEEISLAMAGK